MGREKDGRKRKGDEDEGRDNYLCHKHLSNRRLDLPYRLRANVVNTGWAKKSKPDNFCNNFVHCQPLLIIFDNLQPEDI